MRVAGAALVVLLAALVPAGGAARADDAAAPIARVKAAGYRHARVLAARGERTLMEAQQHDQAVLLLVRDGGAAPLVVASELAMHQPDKTRGRLSPFFGRADLLDVTVELRVDSGMGGSSTEAHYLVRLTGDVDRVACAFTRESSSGMEDVSTSTSGVVRKVKSAPLTFEVEHSTTSRGHPGELLGQRRPSVTRYVVPARGRCSVEEDSSSLEELGGIPR